jgi:hypothetical protein
MEFDIEWRMESKFRHEIPLEIVHLGFAVFRVLVRSWSKIEHQTALLRSLL